MKKSRGTVFFFSSIMAEELPAHPRGVDTHAKALEDEGGGHHVKDVFSDGVRTRTNTLCGGGVKAPEKTMRRTVKR